MSALTGALAQSADSLITDLQFIDKNTRQQGCPNPLIISHRAMNLFISDKIGYYLTDYKNLSFYKNYITLNAREGIFSLNHNLFQPSGTDEPVKTFYVVGVRANVISAFTTAFTEKTGTNQLGATMQKTWIARPKTRLADCFDKTIMDARRATELTLLTREIKQKEAEFIQSLASIKRDHMADADIEQAKKILLQDFYEQLRDEYSRRFAYQQYQNLVTANRYKRITTHWTTISVYLPVVLQRFTVARSLTLPAETKKVYPFDITLSHTRFWESKRSGRVFLSLEAAIFLNNAVQSFLLTDMNYNQYKSAGGIDTLSLSQRNINSLSIGHYQTFLTPAARFTLVYYPPESHIGLSVRAEQHIGMYKALNCVLGIPVVLIDKQGVPAATFEFQLRYADCTHIVFPHRTLSDNLSVNLIVGVPFSKIVY